MEELPLVTLGLCTKNNAMTIKSTIKSILSQDYPLERIQLIVVDGLSSDRTLDILKEILETSSLNYMLLSDHGKGLAFARQLVVDNSSAEYIIWVDGDHILSTDFVSMHVDFMKKNPEVGAAVGLMEYLAVNIISKLEGYTYQIYNLKKLGKDLNVISDGGAVFRLKVIRSVGGFDVRIKGAGIDLDITHRINVAGWKLRMNPRAKFKHVVRTSLRSLWKEYFWWGYGAHFISHKHRGLVNPYRFLPPVAFLAGIRFGAKGYIMTKDISCLLMPLHYAWKRTAWICGFCSAHLDGYGHERVTATNQ